MSFNPIQNANKSSFLDARVIEDHTAAVHQNCAKAPGGNTLSEGCLICLLPGIPRNITIQYLDDKQRDEALLSCSLLSHHIFPGWHPKECRDDKIRDLFVARTQDLV